MFVIVRALHFTVSITPTKVESVSRRASFQNFCAIVSILKLLIIAKIAAANYDVRVSRYQSICDFYRYFTASYNADFSHVEGLFYTFHFLPSHRALAFFNTTRREAKAQLKNDSAVKKYFYLTRILYFNNEEKTFQMVIPVYGNKQWRKSQSE